MKIALLGDIHLKSTDDSVLLSDKLNTIDQFVNFCLNADNNIECCILLGDIFDNINPPQWLRDKFFDSLHLLFGKMPIHFVLGNHDIGSKSINLLVELKYLGANNNIVFNTKPYLLQKGIVIAPYRYDKDAVAAISADVLITHNGFENGLVGYYNLPLNDPLYDAGSVKRFKKVISGHYHKPQNYHLGDTDVYYAGSTSKIDFSEQGETKRFLVYDTDNNSILSVIFANQRNWVQLNVAEEQDLLHELSSLSQGDVVKLSLYGSKRWASIINVQDVMDYLYNIKKVAKFVPIDVHYTDDATKRVDKKFLALDPLAQIVSYAKSKDKESISDLGKKLFSDAQKDSN